MTIGLAMAATAAALIASTAAAQQTATVAENGAIYISADGLAARDPGFERIIAAPGEPELNLDYARERAAAGDLLSATAALERVLLGQPNWHAARLFYAALLYRLDDLQEVRRELDILDAANLNPAQRGEVKRLRDLLARRGEQTLLSGQVALGLAYDGDAVGALASAVDLDSGIPLRDDGLAVTASGGVAVRHKLDERDRSALYASATVVSKTDISGVDQRYVRAEGQAGLAFRLGGTGVRAGGLFRHYALFGDPYLDEWGGRIETTTPLSPRTALIGSLEVVDQGFSEADTIIGLPQAEGRDGVRLDVGLGLSHRLTARQTIGVEAGWEDKDAELASLAYAGPRLYAAYMALLGRGAYASLSAMLRFLDYDAVDPLTGVERKDSRVYVRGALGAPFSAFTASGATGDFREALRLEGSLNYALREARAPYLDYDSVGAEVRMIYRFGE